MKSAVDPHPPRLARRIPRNPRPIRQYPRPGFGCVIIAENLGQTDEVFLKIDEYLERLGVLASPASLLFR